MNKFTMSQIQIGDVFKCVETGNIYKLLSIKKDWRSDGTLYEFLDMKIEQSWTFSKRQFMKRLKPVEGAAAVLYNEIQDR